MLIRFDVITGIETSSRTRFVTPVKARRGTMVAIVGTCDSCQVKWVEIIDAPAALDRLGQQRNLIPAHSPLEHIHRRNAENDDAVLTQRFPDSTHHLHRKAHSDSRSCHPIDQCVDWFFLPER